MSDNLAGPWLSILLILLAGLLLLTMLAVLLVTAVWRKPVRWKLPLAGIVVAAALGIYGAVSLAAWAGRKAVQTGQTIAQKAPGAASDLLSGGANIVLEGGGKTVDYFAEKWRNEALADLRQLQVTPVGQSADGAGEHTTASIEILVKNPTERTIDLDSIVRARLLLATDAEGVAYEPETWNARSTLPPGTTTRHQLKFNLPRRIALTGLNIFGAPAPLKLPATMPASGAAY